MTKETYEIEKSTGVLQTASTREPWRNPSYPQRDHYAERSKLQEALDSAEGRVEAAAKALEAGGHAAGERVKLYHQLLGTRDQIAECARRMPLEAGELYHEDDERFKQAMAALDRVWRQWEKASG